MDESSSDFRDTLLELIETSPEPMDHPSPDRWIAYHRGELPAAEEARLQEHLARCRDCFDLAEGAAAFAPPDAEPGAGQEVGTAALWRLLRPRRRPSWKSRLPTTLAASFFVALMGMTVWNVRQQSDLKRLREPRPASIFDFSAERLPGSAEKTLSASTGVLVFHPDGDLPVYRVTLLDAATGRERWFKEMPLDEDFALKVLVPELRPGRYRIEISDGSGGRAGKVVETHLVRVEADRGE